MMLIVGERINMSREPIMKAVKGRDAEFLIGEARKQLENGAGMIDVNCGLSHDKEREDMLWLVKVLQDACGCQLCIDSPDPEVIKAALKVHKGTAMVNSITAEKARYESILPACKDSDCRIVALTMDEKGMPSTAQDRFEMATIIMEICNEYGISKERLYFDPLIRPISTEPGQAIEILRSIELMKEIGLKTIAGVSNISYGLPNRRLINRTFIAMAAAFGLDAAILDPTDSQMMSAVYASDALMGKDEYAMKYISLYREQRLSV